MTTIKLFCSAGMSTSMLVTKMRAAAATIGLEVNIEAMSEGQMSKQLENMDVALLGPQIGFKLASSKKLCDSVGIPVAVIPTMDYGMMNGEKVLDFALKLIEDYKK
ncbi:phosphotransferase system, lactose/cellobiose-specific IIB subunit [Paenibacillus sp. FSL R7-277]|uniref:PTS sugar transporter subunit IIB n=1 Tax=Paenibacillus sp. FSL R7-277 TaxID=1227352 RepID=UPI0003E29099|nr:PTS sugar transporter subunit IIB [Paenibacillus sp. FSL R7-277]ETT74508.1 phosphotransferase system, lactose/cellobiose-specific IIB subunit [Paenibacillus sp. FSL R7-277]